MTVDDPSAAKAAHRPLRYTYADYVEFPDDGQRYELIDGELFVTPAPNPDHQRCIASLHIQVQRWVEAHPTTEVLFSPIDLILADDTVVQPDLLVVFEPGSVTRRGIEAAPALAIEVLSPSTRSRDKGLKRQRYARAGVREYWLVDPRARTVEIFEFAGAEGSGGLQSVGVVGERERFTSRLLPGLDLDVAEVFRRVSRSAE